jgi:acetoacetyl-CoA synthetase
MTVEGELLWTPRPEFAASSHVMRYLDWLRRERGIDLAEYDALWNWSVSELEAFWASLWDYFDVQSSTPYRAVLSERRMQGAKWFEGSQLNYAEHLLRHEAGAPDRVALHHLSELRPLARMTVAELGAQVRTLATSMRELGIGPGDRVVSYLPNIAETAVAMMATIAIGAVWSSAAPEFGIKTVVERFAQIKPKLMFAADGYRFGGKDFPRSAEVQGIAAQLPSLQTVIWLPYLDAALPAPVLHGASRTWASMFERPVVAREEFQYTRVAYDHPLWVLFSSGTTGLPKAIVHSHVGALVEHLKLTHFHFGLGPQSAMFFYSTTGWVMWNLVLSALLTGGAAVLYDGSPAHPRPDLLWKLAADTGTTFFGASPTFIQLMEKAGLKPGERFDLSKLEAIMVGGSPSTPETFAWLYACVKRDLWVTSQSGGTEIASGFVGASPTLPVYAGEIQRRMLGMDVHAWSDDGRELVDEVGELVVTRPFPSMPLYFWNDPDGRRYHEAYFDVFPEVWRHGDFVKINRRGGCYIYGRSDSTLNRHGVRIGTAEVYRAVEQVAGIADSLVVCCELPGGAFYMPLFVRLKDGVVLDDALLQAICGRLREDCSPRHVPDVVHAVAQIPYTLTGKKMEVPVRKLLMGWPLEKAASRDAMMNPGAIDTFVRFAAEAPELEPVRAAAR